MKILVITSRYPPYHFGGYEIRCKNIVDELSRRGHEILVTTSIKERRLRQVHPTASYPILRSLHTQLNVNSFIARLTLRSWSYRFGILLVFVRELFFDLLDMKFIERQIKQFQPDMIYLGHITIFSRALMPFLAGCALPIVYDEGGSGLIDSWTESGIWCKFVEEFSSRYSLLNEIKSLLIKIIVWISANRLKSHWGWPADMQIIFNSELNRQNAVSRGVPVLGSQVIHSGIDTEKFTFIPKTKFGSPLLLIVPGRIEPRKGQLDAVRLLVTLQEKGIDAKLLLVGERWVSSYYLEIEQEIEENYLNNRVSFLPMIEQDKLIEFYQRTDICFFPSYYRTGFSRVPLEAMACGCIVISYGNEGSDEVIRDGYTGFLVPPAEYSGIANIIKELISNPERVMDIVSTARKEIEDDSSMDRYVDRIEEMIINTVGIH